MKSYLPLTTVADLASIVAENLLLGQPAPTAPNQVWVGDIIYLPLVGGHWCYLEEARLEVAYYLDTYFNLDCQHSALGYCSPHQFERNFQFSLS